MSPLGNKPLSGPVPVVQMPSATASQKQPAKLPELKGGSNVGKLLVVLVIAIGIAAAAYFLLPSY